jgi:SAM-dependent methyltransferase
MSEGNAANTRGTKPYASPRTVTALEDCYFYHTIDIPGYGLVEGEWDLRSGIDEYLGRFDFRGRRVLELGTASGFVCLHMESQGAEVVAYDLSDEHDWDVVPYAQYDHRRFMGERRAHIKRLNNSFWLCHRAFNSQSMMVYGDIYSIPPEIGDVDVSTFCSILLHVRDPFLALQKALTLTREAVIVTEPTGRLPIPSVIRAYTGIFRRKPLATFMPDSRRCDPRETWWRLSPQLIQRFIAVLGFERSTVSYHYQKYRRGRLIVPLPQFTVVGHRTS